MELYDTLVFMFGACHFEKYNAVISGVTPCKYVFSDVVSGSERIEGGERAWVRTVRDGEVTGKHSFSKLSALKSAKAAELEIDF